MQSKSIDEDTRIYIRPTAEMRRRLERLMDLKPWELLKAHETGIRRCQGTSTVV